MTGDFMKDRDTFTVRLVTKEDRTRSHLTALFAVDDPSAPKAVAILPVDDMTSSDLVFLREHTSRELASATEVILEFLDAAQAYQILEDFEKASLFSGPGRAEPVAAELWVVKRDQWSCVEEDLWSDPLWRHPEELADWVKTLDSQVVPTL